MISHEELYTLIDTVNNDRTKKLALSLAEAINDWPKLDLLEPIDFIEELKSVISGKLALHKIVLHMNELNSSKDGWKSESLTSVVKMFDYVNSPSTDDLESIILSLGK